MLAGMADASREMAALQPLLDKRQREAAILAIAVRQFGPVSRVQLLGLGLGAGAIRSRLAQGRLHRRHRGVYALGRPELSLRGRWMAAVLAADPALAGHGTLGFRAAAGLWAIRGFGDGAIDVICPHARSNQPGLRFHRMRPADDELTAVDGIPVTGISRTLLDLATVLQPHELEAAMSEANRRGITDRVSLPLLLERYPRRSGTPVIREIFARRAQDASEVRSRLELRFMAFLDANELPRPRFNQWLPVGPGYEVDCAWPDARLIVELDSVVFHADARRFQGDRARDRALVAAGWRVVRLTWAQLRDEPEQVAADLRSMLSVRGPSGSTRDRS